MLKQKELMVLLKYTKKSFVSSYEEATIDSRNKPSKQQSSASTTNMVNQSTNEDNQNKLPSLII